MASSSKDSASCSEDSVSLLTAGVEGMALGQGTVFKVMSINIGKHKKDDKKEKVYAQQKREKVVDLLNKENPDLVFLQKCSSARELEKSLPPSFKCAEGALNDKNKSCSCIVFNKDNIEVNNLLFNEDNIEVNDFGITHLYLKKIGKLSDKGEFLQRLFVRRCKSLDLLVASYHGRYNRKGGQGGLTDEEKKNIFSELLILLDEVCNKAECKVLVGGGFNLKYAKAKEVIQERSTIASTQVASSVTSSSRKSNHIEYKYNLYTEGSQGKPMDYMVDYFMYNGPQGDVSNVRVGDAIDHQSLYADFKLK